MKTINKLWLKCLNAILAGVFGISTTACKVMYGVPHADYDVTGSVLNEKFEGIEGAQVIIKSYSDFERTDTVYTNAEGAFHDEYATHSSSGDCLELIVNDPKGEYQSDTVHISNRRMEVVEDGDWYDAYAIDNIYVTLKKK